VAAAALLASAGAQAASPAHPLLVGGVEDSAMYGASNAYMGLARSANFRMIVLSSIWRRGEITPDAQELARLVSSAKAARNAGITPVIAVYPFARDTPVTADARAQFVVYAVAIEHAIPNLRYMSIGNEPNSRVFWAQRVGGGAAATYYQLLAQAYDVLKVNDPKLTVIGCSLAAQHAPARFIRELGVAFRSSGRGRLFMDLFSLHPYPPNPDVPPTVGYGDSSSIGIADYPRLVSLLTSALGTAPPIAYGEYGIETRVPRGALSMYSGAQPATAGAVSEYRQAEDYVAAIGLAACQPLVRMLLFFHVNDETSLSGLQTGLFYPSGQPKRSLEPVAQAAQEAAQGQVNCHP
jgi:hypothetical protein